jgi:hypothetical protein
MTITIELVRVGDRLVGRTVSDRFNLISLGVGVIEHDRNQRAVKSIRRLIDHMAGGFRVSVVKAPLVVMPTESESAAFDGAVPAELSRAA